MKGFSLNLVRLTESYALCLSTEGKSPKTITWYTANLKRFAQFLSDNHIPNSVDEIGKEEGKKISRKSMRQALQTYYKMSGWDPERAVPTVEKLQELDLEWVVEELDKTAKKE